MQRLLLEDPWIEVDVELRPVRESGSYGAGFMDRVALALSGPLIDIAVTIYADGMASVDTINRAATNAEECHELLLAAMMRTLYWAIKDLGYQADIVISGPDHYVRTTFDNGVRVDIKWNRDMHKLVHYGPIMGVAAFRQATVFKTVKEVRDFIFDYKDY